jgi:hypothetical protein
MPSEKQKSSEPRLTKSDARRAESSIFTLGKIILLNWCKEAEDLAKSTNDPAPGDSDR